MGLKTIWRNNRVLIVMGTGLVLIHWGWYKIQSNPIFHPKRDELPEPGVVTYTPEHKNRAKGK
ncbi:uncharacterized protein LOC143826818 [Paroedura picta]|uniref:uncharacterized protein LOC143826818 n=1 Tax=Paroedura picta TaxID=143630 RepID=UPI004057A56A